MRADNPGLGFQSNIKRYEKDEKHLQNPDFFNLGCHFGSLQYLYGNTDRNTHANSDQFANIHTYA
jgi:hypothetical protein